MEGNNDYSVLLEKIEKMEEVRKLLIILFHNLNFDYNFFFVSLLKGIEINAKNNSKQKSLQQQRFG